MYRKRYGNVKMVAVPSTDVDNGIFTCIGSSVMPAGGRVGESLVIQLR